MRFSICVILFIVHSVNAVLIEFYKNRNYTGLIHQSSSTDKCTVFPETKVQSVNSIITDTCLIVHEQDSNCKSRASRKFLPGRSNNWGWCVRSFHLCNDEEGGPQLNLNITKYRGGSDPEVIASYRAVCSCINIPKHVQNMDKWSIDNHGNEVLAYYEPNCSDKKWTPLNIAPGHWFDSRDIYNRLKTDELTKINHKIQSIGPVKNSTYFEISCCATCTYEHIMQLELLETNSNLTQQFDLELGENSIHTNGISASTRDPDRVIFFTRSNFHGVHLEINSNPNCSNIQTSNIGSEAAGVIGSLKTKTCLILYSNTECGGRSIKIISNEIRNLTKVWESTVTSRKTLSLLYQSNFNMKWTTGSFHACNDNVGGLTLNVDITEYNPDETSTVIPVVLQSFKNVCSCQNVPYEIQILEKWSINNYGNTMVAYFEHDCLSTPFAPLKIPAGRSSFSMGFGSFKKSDQSDETVQKIQSFGPDPHAEYFKTSCGENSSINLNMTGNISQVQNQSILNEPNQDHTNKPDSLANDINPPPLIPNLHEIILSEFQKLEQKLEDNRRHLEDMIEKQNEKIEDLSRICKVKGGD